MSRQRLSNHSNEEYVARFRTEVCAEYVAGECVFSADECFQTHGKVPQRRKPFRNGFKEHCYSPVLCLFYPKCCSGAKCPLAHGKMEEDYHPKNFRKVTCRFAAKTLPGGACPIRGPHCSFAHSEIRSPEGTAQNGMSERSTPAAEEELWVVRTYKTEQCDVRSEAQCPRGAHCSRFHTPFERRRNPFKISYGPRRCAFRWEDPYTLSFLFELFVYIF